MHGHGVARERVHGEDVELLGLPASELLLHHDAGVAEEDVHVGAPLLRVLEEGEEAVRDLEDLGIDLVVAQVVAGRPGRPLRVRWIGVDRDRPRAEAHHTDAELPRERVPLRVVRDGQSHAAGSPVVGRGPGQLVRMQVLGAVPDRPVVEHALAETGLIRLQVGDVEHSVEAPPGREDRCPLLEDLPAEEDDQGDRPDRRRDHGRPSAPLRQRRRGPPASLRRLRRAEEVPAHEGHDETAGGDHPELVLPESIEDERRHHRDQHSSRRPPERHHQVIEGQLLRPRLQPR